MQDAINDGIKAGLRGISPSAELASGGSDGGAAAQLEAQRVSRVWLDKYLSGSQRQATASLSLFAASFDAVGAAAVLSGARAHSQQAEADQMLQSLREISIIQELRQSAAEDQIRHTMHPLLRDLTIELRQGQPDADHKAAVIGFVSYMLTVVGFKLASLGQAAVHAPDAAQLLDWEAPDLAAMVQLVAALDWHGADAMVKEDSQRGEGCRDVMDHLAVALSDRGQLQLAEQAGRVACNARSLWPADSKTVDSMINLSIWLAELGQHEAAADITQQALEACQRVLGSQHRNMLVSVDSLGSRSAETAQPNAVADMARRTLKARQRVLGPEHPATLTAWLFSVASLPS